MSWPAMESFRYIIDWTTAGLRKKKRSTIYRRPNVAVTPNTPNNVATLSTVRISHDTAVFEYSARSYAIVSIVPSLSRANKTIMSAVTG